MFKYMHIERLGTINTEGILNGLCYCFPKLDGTNGQVSFNIEKNIIECGSRNNILSEASTNRGFYPYVLCNQNLIAFCKENPNILLFGEFLVPYRLKTYLDDAWNKFYIFDVMDKTTRKLIHYEHYKDLLDKYNLLYLKPICMINNPTIEDLQKIVQENTYLIKEGQGLGEGIVIKNYNFYNKFGNQIWAKIVIEGFKNSFNGKIEKGIDANSIENLIVEKFCTPHLIEKTYAKIIETGWNSKKTLEFLNRTYYDLVTEEIWEINRYFKEPIINFKKLKSIVFQKIQSIKPELF